MQLKILRFKGAGPNTVSLGWCYILTDDPLMSLKTTNYIHNAAPSYCCNTLASAVYVFFRTRPALECRFLNTCNLMQQRDFSKYTHLTLQTAILQAKNRTSQHGTGKRLSVTVFLMLRYCCFQSLNFGF